MARPSVRTAVLRAPLGADPSGGAAREVQPPGQLPPGQLPLAQPPHVVPPVEQKLSSTATRDGSLNAVRRGLRDSSSEMESCLKDIWQ